ncbi:MAG: MopE-related protein, partial [Myxococcota bacterium]
MRAPLALALLSACASSWTLRDQDGDGHVDDCNERDAGIHPAAAEVFYDGVDQNCDGASDYDKDGDGADAIEHGGADCWDDPDALPDSFVALNGLPQLRADEVHPGALADVPYDGVDADCAGDSDFDADGDGYDASQVPQRDGTAGDDCYDAEGQTYPADTTCEGSGETLAPEDVHPGAQDVTYDGTDADCAGDDLDFDDDGDGFDACEECDDTDPTAFPGDVEEVWYDGVDQDCDGNDCDQDGDGVCAEGVEDLYGTHAAGDCWDAPDDVPDDQRGGELSAQDVYPGAADAWYDGHDSDCDGWDDFDQDGDGHRSDADVDPDGAVGDDCDDASAESYPGAFEIWYDGVDADCAGDDDYDQDRDGYPSSAYTGDDCDDTKDAVHPGAPEDCATAYDDDCDGALDREDADGCTPFWFDGDGDGHGLTAAGEQCWCEAQTTTGWTATTAEDCDDADGDYHPGAAETDCADPNDYNCDGSVAYDDADADGWAACLECDDADADDHPGADEVVNNGDDEDCDGVDACYEDTDDDGYGSTLVIASGDLDCADALEAANDDDCDDAVATTYPGAAETPDDGVDADCDGAEACYTDGDGDGYGISTFTASADLDCADPGEADDTD